ncbi:hypothetical protein NL676_012177 [Syzygium grande]|nr:hypothetical protein NL676_012177 [Syzygium grande]
MEDLLPSTAAYSLFGSTLTIGALLGALVNGWMTDMMGRRRTMEIAQIIFIAGWLFIAFAENAWWLNIGRLLNGVGYGIICYVFLLCCGISLIFFLGTIVSRRVLALIGTLEEPRNVVIIIILI